MTAHNEIIDRWPSVLEFSKDIGATHGAAIKWRQRSSIPAGYWLALVTAAKDRGFQVTLQELAEGKHKAA